MRPTTVVAEPQEDDDAQPEDRADREDDSDDERHGRAGSRALPRGIDGAPGDQVFLAFVIAMRSAAAVAAAASSSTTCMTVVIDFDGSIRSLTKNMTDLKKK